MLEGGQLDRLKCNSSRTALKPVEEIALIQM